MSQPAPARYAIEPARIAVNADDEAGMIVRVDGRVVAILIRLDSPFYAEDRGRWYVEAAFGRCAGSLPSTFARLSEAILWIADRLGDRVDELGGVLAEAERHGGTAVTNVVPFPGRPSR